MDGDTPHRDGPHSEEPHRDEPHRDGPWIEILRDGRESEDLLRVYDDCRIKPQDADNILAIHSLNPPSLLGHYALYRTLMYESSPLSRVERESIAVAVSVRNECHY